MAEWVHQLLRPEIELHPSISRATEPIARAVQATGISEYEFDELVEQARREAWDEQNYTVESSASALVSPATSINFL